MSFVNDTKPSGSDTRDRNSTLILWDDAVATWDDLNYSVIASLLDSYPESNSDNTATLRIGGGIGARTGYSQSFTAVAAKLSSCKFWMKKTGSPTGVANAKLYAHSGIFGSFSVPTGLALAVSDDFNVANLTTSLALTELTFSGVNRYGMAAATNYNIAIEYTDVSGDGSNNIQIGIDTSTPTHAGNQAALVPATGVWGAISTQDLIFYLYGIPLSRTDAYSWDNAQTFSRDTKPTGSFVNDAKP